MCPPLLQASRLEESATSRATARSNAVTSLESQLNDSRAHSASLENSLATIRDELDAAVSKRSDDAANTATATAALQSDLATAQSGAAAAEARASALAEQLALEKTSVIVAGVEAEALLGELESARSDLSKAQGNHTAEVVGLREEIVNAVKAAEEADNARQDAESESKLLVQQLGSHQLEAVTAEKSLKTALESQRIAEEEAAASRVLMEDLVAERGLQRSADADVVALSTEVGELRQLLAEAEAACRRAGDAQEATEKGRCTLMVEERGCCWL